MHCSSNPSPAKRPKYIRLGCGAAGIAHWINSFYSLTGENRIDKHDPIVSKIKDRVAALYEDGRTTVMGDAELEDILKQIDFATYEKLAHINVRITP